MVSIIKDKIEFSSEIFLFQKVGKPGNSVFMQAMFPEGGRTMKHCFLAMFLEGCQTRKQCLLQPSSQKWTNKKQLFPLKKSHEETKYVSELIGKHVRFVRTVSKAGQTAKHSRKLEDFQMFPNLPMGYCLLINIPI
jgi:hypothetical protein